MKYSFLVPVYNVKNYLEQCVDSMLSQTYQDFEIILVDDGSTDGSGEICDQYFSKYPEKVRVIHKKNEGHTSARLEGIHRANGQVCLFVDSDDFVEANLLEIVDRAFSQYDNVDMVMYSFSYFNGGRKKARKDTLSKTVEIYSGDNKKKLYNALIDTSLISSLWSKAIKTDILKQDTTNHEEYYCKKLGEDWFNCIYLVSACEKIVYVNEPLYNYRLNPKSITNTVAIGTLKEKNMLYVYERFLDYLPIWNMDNQETVDRLKARWLNEIMYLFSLYYKSAKRAIDKRAVIDFDWSSMLPEDVPDPYNCFELLQNRRLFQLIQKKQYGRIRWIYIKKAMYQACKKLKARILYGKM